MSKRSQASAACKWSQKSHDGAMMRWFLECLMRHVVHCPPEVQQGQERVNWMPALALGWNWWAGVAFHIGEEFLERLSYTWVTARCRNSAVDRLHRDTPASTTWQVTGLSEQLAKDLDLTASRHAECFWPRRKLVTHRRGRRPSHRFSVRDSLAYLGYWHHPTHNPRMNKILFTL